MRATVKLAIAVFAVSAWFAPASQAAPEPAPAWHLRLAVLPTHLTPDTVGGDSVAPTYQVVATNVGSAAATGPVTLTATLPDDVTPVFNATSPAGFDRDLGSPDPVCSKAEGQSVTCVAAGPVYPSRPVGMRIPVEVAGTLNSGETLPDATASVSSAGANTATTSVPTTIDEEAPEFGFLGGSRGLAMLFSEADGSASVAAGERPEQLTLNVGFPVEQPLAGGIISGAGHPRDVVADLPRGVVVNPTATAARCTEVQLLSGRATDPGCPAESQIGIVTVITDVSGPKAEVSALYNMEAPPGSVGTVAFNAANIGAFVHVNGKLRSETDFGISAVSSDTLARSFNPLEDVQVQLWGQPTAASHDQIRDECRNEPAAVPCSIDPGETPLLTLPSACSDTLEGAAHARSWEESNKGITELRHHITAAAADLTGAPVAVGSCSQLDFKPSIELQPDSSAAETPTGVSIAMSVPQPEGAARATSNVKDITFELPPGLAVNPAAADGQQACNPAQIGMLTGVGESPVHLSDDPPGCPDAAKLGTLEVDTPVLDHTLPGAVYLAEPYQNPFGTLLAAYLVIDSPRDGLVAKVASKIEADPDTGQLTATVEESPELPFAEVRVDLYGGPRAGLRTPSTCGTYTTEAELVPWSGGETAEESDSFAVTQGPNGKPCVSSEAEMPNHPGFEAGTATPIAASYSPFLGRLTRSDGEQQLKGLRATLPPGLSGKLAGISTCSDAALAVAASKSGQEELASPSCPDSSLVGQATVGAGAGPAPYYTTGKIYLAGPYRGAPLSGVVITPAVAGPFDLGNVVVRAPTYLDPVTAELRLDSDSFPHILEGIPLALRDARISLDRSDFILNPSSCDPMAITGEAISLLNDAAQLSQRFQVGGCRGLDYKPRLFIRLFGRTKRGGHPRLRAVLIAKPGAEANTARASVALPRSEFIENAHFQTICTRVQFAARQCPRGSIYGHARAISPLLDEVLRGPVYLRSSDNELPDMVTLLHGPPDKPIEVELKGRIDSVRGGIRTTFDLVPDQPVTKFILNMKGGRKSLIVNSRNVCARTYRATAKFDGQNGKTHEFRPKLKASCGKRRAAKRHRRPR